MCFLLLLLFLPELNVFWNFRLNSSILVWENKSFNLCYWGSSEAFFLNSITLGLMGCFPVGGNRFKEEEVKDQTTHSDKFCCSKETI